MVPMRASWPSLPGEKPVLSRPVLVVGGGIGGSLVALLADCFIQSFFRYGTSSIMPWSPPPMPFHFPPERKTLVVMICMLRSETPRLFNVGGFHSRDAFSRKLVELFAWFWVLGDKLGQPFNLLSAKGWLFEEDEKSSFSLFVSAQFHFTLCVCVCVCVCVYLIARDLYQC